MNTTGTDRRRKNRLGLWLAALAALGLAPSVKAQTTYDWDFGDGSEHSALQYPSHVYAAAGTYHVVGTVTVNGVACVDEYDVVVCGGPLVTAHPAAAAVCTGLTATLTVAATGTATLHYQWYQGASGTVTAPVGEDSPSFTTPAMTEAASYWCRVTNGCGTADSDAAEVLVAPLPSPAISGPTSVCAGSSVTLDAGAGFSTYLWSPGGATTKTVSVSPATTTAYTVAVTSASGCSATSAGHTVTVNAAPSPAITGPSSAFVGSAGNVYSTEAGQSDYAWTVSAGGTVTGGGGPASDTVTVTWNTAGAQSVGVSYSDAGGCAGSSAPYAVEVSAPPADAGPDFNLDGKSDILWRNGTTGEVFAWFMDGAEHFGGAPLGVVADQGWRVVGAADFGGDGKTDLLWRHSFTGDNYLWHMDGVAQAGSVPIDAVPDVEWEIAGTGDFNADGRPDILWRNGSTGENYVWYMDGAVHAGGAPVEAVSDLGWKIAGAADFTGDGKPDVLWRNTSTGQGYIWVMDGTAKAGGSDLGVVPTEWEMAWAADYSGDGKPDILWRNTTTGENHVWYIVGAVQAGGAPVDPVGDLAWKIMTGTR